MVHGPRQHALQQAGVADVGRLTCRRCTQRGRNFKPCTLAEKGVCTPHQPADGLCAVHFLLACVAMTIHDLVHSTVCTCIQFQCLRWCCRVRPPSTSPKLTLSAAPVPDHPWTAQSDERPVRRAHDKQLQGPAPVHVPHTTTAGAVPSSTWRALLYVRYSSSTSSSSSSSSMLQRQRGGEGPSWAASACTHCSNSLPLRHCTYVRLSSVCANKAWFQGTSTSHHAIAASSALSPLLATTSTTAACSTSAGPWAVQKKRTCRDR